MYVEATLIVLQPHRCNFVQCCFITSKCLADDFAYSYIFPILILDDYAVSHDIVYNGSIRCVLICSPNKTVRDPVFCIRNNLIVKKTKAKYLGHIINEDMSDDADVFRQVKCLYIRGNIISRKFANCSINVKLVVFKTYCSCLYTSQLWGTCLYILEQ